MKIKFVKKCDLQLKTLASHSERHNAILLRSQWLCRHSLDVSFHFVFMSPMT